MLEQEQESCVITCICVELGLMNEPRAIELLTKLKNHPVEDVRYYTAFALHGYEDEHAINILVELTQDKSHKVRETATHILGTLIKIDTPTIREVLWKNINDSDEATRYEAFVGLILRRDWNIVERVKRESQFPDLFQLDMEMLVDLYYRLSNWHYKQPDPRLEDVIKYFKKKYYAWNL